ncbi:MAG TPA: protease inhibitor I42 family protein [Chitinophagaceae bacterium]|jgi:predicted secreted protein|nr:protease inhibitor I42 family protein [Chitinophagaceae bacterium]
MKVLTLLIFLYACGASPKSESTKSPQNPESNNPADTTSVKTDSITVKVNETFTIKLGTSMGTGYAWSTTDSTYSKNISLDSVSVISNTEGKEDGADLQVFHFRALVKSTTVLDFIHKRSWEPSEKADKQKKYTVIIK